MAIWIPPENLAMDMKVPEGFPITFSNYTMTQTLSGDVILTFFQAVQPIVTNEEHAKKIKSIPAHCVARVALGQAAALGLLGALSDVLGKAPPVDKG